MKKVSRTALRAFGLLVLLYLLGCGYLYAMQRHYLYAGGNPAPEIGALANVGYQKVAYKTSDGIDLWGFYAPPADAKAPVLLVFHGNTGIGPIVDDRALPLRAQGYGLLLATYRGYDGNNGQPTEAGLHEDADAALTYLLSQNIDSSRVILYGHSLGTAVAADLAYRLAQAKSPAAALILEAPFARMVDMARLRYGYMPVNLLLKDRYDTLSKIASVKTPVMVMHGDADRTVPMAMGKALCDAAQLPKECDYLPGGGHADLYSRGGLEAVTHFITALQNHEMVGPQ